MRFLKWTISLLLIGALINIAVAWAIVYWTPVGLRGPVRGSVLMSSGQCPPYIYWREPGVELVKWHWYLVRDLKDALDYPIGPGRWWSRIASDPEYYTPGQPIVNVRIECAAGWPMRSLRTQYDVDSLGGYVLQPSWGGIQVRNHTAPPPWHLARTCILPTVPVWKGFAVNTAFYALILAPLVGLGVWLRRRRRHRGNMCLQCGYERAGLAVGAVCPECGVAAV